MSFSHRWFTDCVPTRRDGGKGPASIAPSPQVLRFSGLHDANAQEPPGVKNVREGGDTGGT